MVNYNLWISLHPVNGVWTGAKQTGGRAVRWVRKWASEHVKQE